MKYLLDTNVFIQALRRRPSALAGRMMKRIRALNTEDVVVCSIVREELMFGALLSERSVDQAAAMREFLQPFTAIPYNDVAGSWRMRRWSRRQTRPVRGSRRRTSTGTWTHGG